MGWEFTRLVSLSAGPNLDVEYRYQLQVEDVLLIGSYDDVIFADASHGRLPNGFEIKPCMAAQHYFFSSHLQTPETILYLAKELYHKTPRAFTMAIEGQDWELGTTLSEVAGKHLQSALCFFENEFFPTLATARQLL